jgi:glycosidase
VLNIDGWRLDQAYQVPPGMWRQIRGAVEEHSRQRARSGHAWGTLGYMVAEVWRSDKEIARDAYGPPLSPALLSAFDFPMRYRLVQTLAVEESGRGEMPASNLAAGYETHASYPPHAVPNLMLSNHDLVRFGDLIERAGFGGPDTEQYWARLRCAHSFLAV